MILFSCCGWHKEWICCSSTTWTSCRSLSGNGLLLLQFNCYCSPSAAAETGHAKDSHCGLGLYIISACFNCNWILLKHLWKNSTHVYQAGKCFKRVRLKTCYYCVFLYWNWLSWYWNIIPYKFCIKGVIFHHQTEFCLTFFSDFDTFLNTRQPILSGGKHIP